MRHRPPPVPPEFSTSDAQLRRDPRVRYWITQLKRDPEVKPFDLFGEKLAFAQREASGRRRGSSERERAYKRSMRDLTPKLLAPDGEDPHRDMQLLWGLPEMQRFWANWDPRLPATNPGQRRRGPQPNFAAAKAAMTVLAMSGESAYLEDAYHALDRDRELRHAFETLERIAAERAVPSLAGLGPAPKELPLTSYPTVARHLPLIAERCIELCRQTRVELLRSLREIHPGIGRRLMIDGCAVPAWAPQRAPKRGNEAGEAAFRAHCPNAGFRAYTHGKTGKRAVDPNDSADQVLRTDITKAWRGYYKVTLTDFESGALPVVTSVFDASVDEAPALLTLLEDLHQLWPDAEVDDIAGDSAWDEDWACEACLTQYGIHPIFRFHDNRGRQLVGPEHSRDGSVKAIDGRGGLICARHNARATHVGLEGINRVNLQPGEDQPGAIRVRAQCLQGCGRLGLSAAADPSKLVHHPHFDDDGPRASLHAYRLARLDTLNAMESYHNRLKAGFKLGTQGPDRTRLRDLNVVTALMELADLAMVAMAVYDVREQHGIPLDEVEASGATATRRDTETRSRAA